jgi:hypothetical protein
MIYIIFTNKLFHYLKEKVIVMRKITLLVLLFAVVGNIKAALSLWCETVSSGDIPSNYSERVIIEI